MKQNNEEMKSKQNEAEYAKKEQGEAEENLNKKQKEYDDLYTLLHDKENEIEEANKYSESLLDEKKKCLNIISGKDQEIENLKKDLYLNEQKLNDIQDEKNRDWKDLKNERNQLEKEVGHNKERIQELLDDNKRLMKELSESKENFKSDWDNRTRVDLESKDQELDLKSKQIDDMKDQIDDLNNKLRVTNENREVFESEMKERELNSAPNTDRIERMRMDFDEQMRVMSEDLDKVSDELRDKEGENEDLLQQTKDLESKIQ